MKTYLALTGNNFYKHGIPNRKFKIQGLISNVMSPEMLILSNAIRLFELPTIRTFVIISRKYLDLFLDKIIQ